MTSRHIEKHLRSPFTGKLLLALTLGLFVAACATPIREVPEPIPEAHRQDFERHWQPLRSLKPTLNFSRQALASTDTNLRVRDASGLNYEEQAFVGLFQLIENIAQNRYQRRAIAADTRLSLEIEYAVNAIPANVIFGTAFEMSRNGHKRRQVQMANKLTSWEALHASIFKTKADRDKNATYLQSDKHWRVEIAPWFRFTRDHRTLSLLLAIKKQPPASSTALKENTGYVKIILPPIDQSIIDAEAEWLRNDGFMIRMGALALLTAAIDLAIDDALGRFPQGSAKQITTSYPLGSQRRYERAYVLQKKGGRQVFRNLRGWLVSAPLVN